MEMTQHEERCFALVSTYLKQSFGELAEPLDERPGFVVHLGRLGLYIQAVPRGDDAASVAVYTWVGQGISVETPGVAVRLLEFNAQFAYGGLSVDEDGAIAYDYYFPAEGLTKDSLRFLVQAISSTCEEIDDELRMRFG